MTRKHDEPPHAVAATVLRGRTEVLERLDRLQRHAVQRVRSMEGPPYLTMTDPDDPEPLRRQFDRQRERTAAGVRYRVIYDRTAFTQRASADAARHAIRHGETARTLSGTPLHVLIADDDAAVLQIRVTGPDGPPLALLLGPGALMDTLSACFETLWDLAVPLPNGFVTDLTTVDRDILQMMSSGLTDDLIARRLGISRRTVVRRAAALQRRLNANTRFQAGVQAARRGWL